MLNELEKLREKLLDPSFRNRLLNCKELKAQGLFINTTNVDEVYKYLVEDKKEYVFYAEEEKPKGTKHAFFHTKYDKKSLEKRLNNSFEKSKEFLEERGINVLYLSLGMLNWYEDDTSNDEKHSPLLLIPVKIVKKMVQGENVFSLVGTGEDIEPNLTLHKRLLGDFSITMPVLNDDDDKDVSISRYFEDVETKLSKKSRWTVDKETMTLGIFDFRKIMMYNDLDDAKWESNKPSENSLLRKLLQTTETLLSNNTNVSEFRLDNEKIEDIDHIVYSCEIGLPNT